MTNIKQSNFRRLIGTWRTSGNIKSDRENVKLAGMDSYEWILEGNYILHKADVMLGKGRSETFEIIKLNHSPDRAVMQYFNTKGEDGEMSTAIIGDEFKIEGQGLRFEGTINETNTKISGNWYVQAENQEWISFIDLTLEKI